MPQETPTLEEAIRRYLLTQPNHRTRRAYRWPLTHFANIVGPQRLATAITPEDSDVWLAALRERRNRQVTINTRVGEMKAFWNWCVLRGYAATSPARFLKTKRIKRSMRSKAIPEDVLTAMEEAAPNKRQHFNAVRDAAILAILKTYGARAGDVAGMKMDCITVNGELVLHRKGGSEDALPLMEAVAEPLAAWLKLRTALAPDPAHDFLFVNVRTSPGRAYGPLQSSSISTMIQRLSSDSSGRTFRPHSIRHRRGVSLADRGTSPEIIQAVMGHADVRTTLDHYCDLTGARVKAALAADEKAEGESKQPTSQKGKIIPFPYRKIG